MAISGTGVRNDFAVFDAAARKNDVQMVKNWIVVASKLGAPVIRVFSGRARPEGHSFDEALKWMVADFKECAAFGQQHGVMVAVQQHNDFLKTAAETMRLIESVGSDWFGCILDIGSLRQGDPYDEIEKLVPYAVSWQIKENVGRNGKEEPTDLVKIKAIIDRNMALASALNTIGLGRTLIGEQTISPLTGIGIGVYLTLAGSFIAVLAGLAPMPPTHEPVADVAGFSQRPTRSFR